MKILFDCRYIRFPQHDGVSRYSANLVTALSKLHPVTMIIFDKRQLTMLPDLPWVMAPSPTSILETTTARRLNRFTPDVVFTTLQTMGPAGRKFKLVTTVHDLIFFSHPTPPRNQPWPVKIVWRLYHLSWIPQRLLLRRADAHVTVSQTTRRLMIDNCLTPHPIEVVYNATDVHATEDRTRPPGTDLVYMGRFTPYKNVETLAAGMHLLPGYTLHLLSKIVDAERTRLEKLAPPGSLRFYSGASDEVYYGLLRSAAALVTASRDEGFGLPLIEAMGVGTPVVVSDIPVFREVGEGAALFFDQESPEAFAAAVKSLEDPAVWADHSHRSRLAVEKFTWEESARTLLDYLTQVVG